MRPITLELAGFGSFRDETVFDFDGIDFFALVGPTGNGKSTVIDAIGFALYGKVPRHDDRSTASSVVSLGAIEARVRLTFDAGGTRYIAVRTIKIRNDKPKQDVRLETADGTAIAAQVREFNEAIEGILGMPFEDFTRCVALPQGEFQKFLHEEPRQRRAVLVRLLNLGSYESLGKRARERARDLETTVNVLQQQRDQAREEVADCAALQQRRDSLRALQAQVAEVLPNDQALVTAAAEQTAALNEARAIAAKLNAIAIPATVAVFDERVQAATRELGDAVVSTERAAELIEQLQAAEREAQQHGDRTTVELGLRTHAELATATQAIAQHTATVQAKSSKCNDANVALASAETASTLASEAVEVSRTQNRAHALREHLADGDTCPVCEQSIAAVPNHPAPADFTFAQITEREAKQRLEQCRSADNIAQQQRAKATAALEAAATQRQALSTQLSGVADAAILTHTSNELKRLEAELKAAQQAFTEASKQQQTAQRELVQHRANIAQLQSRFDEQRDAVAAFNPPPRTPDNLAGSWNALAQWAADQLVIQEQLVTVSQHAAASASQQRAAIFAPLREAARHLDLAGHDLTGHDLTGLSAQLTAALVGTEKDIERAVADQAKITALDVTIAQRRESQQVTELLGKLLRTDGFVDWLVEEALTTLVDGASRTLYQLSGGQYSLRHGVSADFEIVDHTNADAARSVRSLSGGETFQASLALALALSDQLAELAANGAPKIEAIFLDEGFGTLDPESLDTVATTIENLGSSGRMVGIVTHVRDLAQRVPVRFEITKEGNRSKVQVVTS